MPKLTLAQALERQVARSVSAVDKLLAARCFADYMRVAGPLKLRESGAVKETVFKFLCHCAQSLAERKRSAVIAAPPGIWKSAVFNNLPLWMLGRDQSLRCAMVSLDEGYSANVTNQLRRVLDTSQFKQVFPACVADRDAASMEAKRLQDEAASVGKKRAVNPYQMGKFFIYRHGLDEPTPSVEAVAYDTEAQNRRTDILIADDIQTSKNAFTYEGREKTYRILMNRWAPRLTDIGAKGTMFVLSNCWHEDDLIHRLKPKNAFTSLWVYVAQTRDHFIAEITHDDELCRIARDVMGLEELEPGFFRLPFPASSETYSPEGLALEEVKAPEFFACRFFFRAAKDEDRMFAAWHQRKLCPGTVAEAHKLTRAMEQGLPYFNEHERQRYSFAWGRDISNRKRQGNVLTCWSMDATGILRPVEWHFAKEMDSDQMMRIILNALARGIRPCAVRVEDAATQDNLVREIQIAAARTHAAWLASIVEPHQTNGSTKWDPEKGLPFVAGLIRNGSETPPRSPFIEWPEGMAAEPHVGHWWRMAGTQIAQCPRHPGPNETPDAPMAMWFAIMGLFQRGNLAAAHNSRNQTFRTF